MVRRASVLVRLVFCPACWCSSHSVRLLGGRSCLSWYSCASRFSSAVTATARELTAARFAARSRERAACRGTRIEVFFPGRGETADPARQVCARRPVRQQCLEFAVSNRIVYGIWGGDDRPLVRPVPHDGEADRAQGEPGCPRGT
jgi:WhiB family transcriptional regulator, redox-sensing transcriptional regulator